MKTTVLAMLLLSIFAAAQDASELEAQYKTCAKHFIPADKCTPEIYRQLKAKDEAPLDDKTAATLKAVKEYQSRLKNRESMQLHTAYFTDEGAICLEIGGQNGSGGTSVSRVVYVTADWKGAKRLRNHWLDEGGFGGAASSDAEHSLGSGLDVDRWPGICQKNKVFGRGGDMKPGTDLTEKIIHVLKQ